MNSMIVAHDPHGHIAAARTYGAAGVPRRLTGLRPADDWRLARARRLLWKLLGAVLTALLIPATRPYALQALAYALAIASYGGLVFVTESICIILLQRCADVVRRGRERISGC